MTSPTSKTLNLLQTAGTSPLTRARPGASRKKFVQNTHNQLVIKQIPSTPALNKPPILSSAALAPESAIMDWSWFVRTAAIEPCFLTSSGMVVDNALGFTTISNLPQGIVGVINAKEEYDQAIARHDIVTADVATLKMGGNFLQALFGAIYIGLRTGSIASVWNKTQTLAHYLKAFGLLGEIVLVLAQIPVGIVGLIQWSRAHRFYKEFEAHGKTFQHVIGTIFVSPDAIAQTILDQTSSLRLTGRIALEKACLNAEAAESAETLYNHLPKEERMKILDAMLVTLFADHPQLPILKEFYFSKLDKEVVHNLELSTVIGLLLHIEHLQKINEVRFESIFGSACLEKVKKAAMRGLEARCADSTPENVRNNARLERAQLLDEVDSKYAETQKSNMRSIALAVVVIAIGVFTLAGFLASGPIGPSVLLGLWILYELTCLYLDIKQLDNAFDGRPGRYDKSFIKTRAFWIAVGLSISIAACIVLSGGTALLAASIILGVSMLIAYYVAHRRLDAQEKQWKEDHPSLDNLKQRLSLMDQESPIDAHLRAQFKKLSKRERILITDAAAQLPSYRYMGWDLARHFGDNFQFGRSCLEAYLNGEPFAESEIDYLRRAVKKTAKFFWTQWWYSNQQEYFKEQALKLEELLANIQTASQAKCAYKKIELCSDMTLQNTLYANIQRVFKREESVGSLYRAVSTVKEMYDYQVQHISA